MPIASASSLNAAGSGAATSAGSTKSGTPAIGQADFMKLLMAQLRNQNPLDPQNGAEFASQLAQFSSLDGINKLNQNFTSMLALQGLSQGANLIGKNVVYTKDADGNTARGTVNSVSLINGQVHLAIGNATVSLNQIRSIEAGPKNT